MFGHEDAGGGAAGGVHGGVSVWPGENSHLLHDHDGRPTRVRRPSLVSASLWSVASVMLEPQLETGDLRLGDPVRRRARAVRPEMPHRT